jgi:hypothetical protein
MRSKSPGILRLAAICLVWLSGCLSGDRIPYSRDPLVASRRAVRGKEGREPPALLVFAEPSQPALPSAAYAALPPAYRIGSDVPPLFTPAPVLADATATPPLAHKPVFATLAPRAKTTGAVRALPVSRHKPPANYSHAANFSWIQGALASWATGQWLLRYSESAADDPWDGCVALADDPRLASLQSGDFVRVEGEIISVQSEDEQPPLYRVLKLDVIR